MLVLNTTQNQKQHTFPMALTLHNLKVFGNDWSRDTFQDGHFEWLQFLCLSAALRPITYVIAHDINQTFPCYCGESFLHLGLSKALAYGSWLLSSSALHLYISTGSNLFPTLQLPCMAHQEAVASAYHPFSFILHVFTSTLSPIFSLVLELCFTLKYSFWCLLGFFDVC